ncbi:alcohol dehydrogenase-like 7 [Phtheirospermum japonicum]|uniref:Alcohol dehydrogenase-like 7 n=1 Tax=Phtheirospermum japonicum TaxID=374723 RepID=A0A830D490_9LAMI|nr:alcohol dehydrogenase-like 7 [Phtheirospermum japonicum]
MDNAAVGSGKTAGKPIKCRECTDCKSKKSNLCSKFPFKVSPWMHDGTSRFTNVNGETLYHFLYVSSFTEYTVIHAANVTKIDPTIPPNRACLLSCGASTGVGAAWKSAKVEAGSTVAIFGLGSIGLAVAEGARLCGAAKIIGIDVNPEKFEISKAFGVTDFVDSSSCGDKRVSEIIIEMTGGGADYCFECVGKASLELELDKFVTHEIGFQDINKAFDLLLEGKSLRCVICMDK